MNLYLVMVRERREFCVGSPCLNSFHPAPSLAYPPNVYTASSPHLAEAHRVQIQLYEQAQTQARIQALADNQARDQIGDWGGCRTLGVDDVEAVLRVPPPEYGKEPPKYA